MTKTITMTKTIITGISFNNIDFQFHSFTFRKLLIIFRLRMKLKFHFSFTTIRKCLNQYHQCHHFVTF